MIKRSCRKDEPLADRRGDEQRRRQECHRGSKGRKAGKGAVVVKVRKCDEPEITQNHGVKIEPKKIAEAKSAERKGGRDNCERRDICRGRIEARFVEQQDVVAR